MFTKRKWPRPCEIKHVSNKKLRGLYNGGGKNSEGLAGNKENGHDCEQQKNERYQSLSRPKTVIPNLNIKSLRMMIEVNLSFKTNL